MPKRSEGVGKLTSSSRNDITIAINRKTITWRFKLLAQAWLHDSVSTISCEEKEERWQLSETCTTHNYNYRYHYNKKLSLSLLFSHRTTNQLPWPMKWPLIQASSMIKFECSSHGVPIDLCITEGKLSFSPSQVILKSHWLFVHKQIVPVGTFASTGQLTVTPSQWSVAG